MIAVAHPAILDPQVPSIQPPQLPQSTFERGNTRLRFRVIGGHRHQGDDPPPAAGLLRAHRERQRHRCAAECGQQFPPSDGDWHAPLSVRGCLKNTIPRRVHAVSTFKKEGWLLLGGL
jgi:hypothetical protein